jgi:hypothetical protein
VLKIHRAAAGEKFKTSRCAEGEGETRRIEHEVKRTCTLEIIIIMKKEGRGRRKAVGKKARPHLDPLPQEREMIKGALGESNRIKPNQTESNLRRRGLKVQF